MNEPGLFISTSRGDGKVVDMLNNIFREAAQKGASDVHIEDYDNGCRIRYRYNGTLEEMINVDHATSLAMGDKIRMKAKLSQSERLAPMDGRFTMMVGHNDGRVDMRVSIVPTIHGQTTVCRLLDEANAQRKLADIMMSEASRRVLDGVLASPDGLLLVTGPTGSGKTSTLYACLNEINKPDIKIMTVEDPVEYTLPYLNQVNVTRNMDFNDAVRAALRQDPDAILIGEIRDSITANVALKAANTGHLVFSTLHTNDAASTLTRMIDLGVDPYVLGLTIRGVVAQRLLPAVCPSCKEMVSAGQSNEAWLDKIGYEGERIFPVAKGCTECNFTGEKGRVPILEVIAGDRAVCLAVETGDVRNVTTAAMQQPQYKTLAEAAIDMAANGYIRLKAARTLFGSDYGF